MCSNNSDFIIRACRDKKTGENKNVLRRYKGSDSVVVIPDSVNMISDNIFADDIESNTFVEKIIIPDSVTEISSNAFAWCIGLEEIDFPKTLKEFNVNFDSCPSIEEINIPESVKKIGCFNCGKNLKKISVGENICEVSVQSFFKNKKSTAFTPMEIANVLLSNPAYSIDEGFLVNKKHRTTLLRLSSENTDVRIPDGIRTIGTNTFYESYQHLKSVPEMKPVEKITIPESVKKIKDGAFVNCNSLKEVIYEGNSREIEINGWAFFSCVNFSKDGREIVCRDTPKDEKKNLKATNLRIERIAVILKLIKAGSYPNSNDLLDACNKSFWGDDEEQYWSLSTISRDLEFLRYRLNVPIEYDFYHKGYCYADKDFTLNLEDLLLR